jgi:glycosyltransferase involved in cell wall biosynthesis
MAWTPLVSVITATYNWPEALALSIPSVLRQRYRNWELHVIGDGCTDGSAELVATFKDPRVHWHNLPRNSGSQGLPNNFGIDSARGELIAYLGHDDLWSEDHLESLVRLHGGAGDFFASAVVAWFDEDVEIHQLTGLPTGQKFSVPTLRSLAMTPSGIIHGRALVNAVGPWADWRAIADPPDVEFFKRIIGHAGEAKRSSRVTVAKVAAGLRENSYRRRDVSPQREILARMAANPHYLRDAAFSFVLENIPGEREVLKVAARRWLRQLVGILTARRLRQRLRPPAKPLPGALVRQLRRVRGLEEV